MKSVEPSVDSFLYLQVSEYIKKGFKEQRFNLGDKLPSLRALSARLEVSIPTVQQAYEELERQGLIESRPKSGFYVVDDSSGMQRLSRPAFNAKPRVVKRQSLIDTVFDIAHRPGFLPLAISSPATALNTDKALNRTVRRITARAHLNTTAYAPIGGDHLLRQQISRLYYEHGLDVPAEAVTITNGAQEAIAISLMCIARAGDTIAVESPTYFGLLELIESLGMKALEIPACPENGLCLDDLEQALTSFRVTALMACTAINNPLGSLMPDAKRKRMVELLDKYHVPLIEDDVYSDLYFHGSRPKPAQCYTQKDLVMTCSSFSKTTAPGYRIGWIVSEKHHEKIRKIKRSLSCSSSLLHQRTLSEFLATGEYFAATRRLRTTLMRNRERMQRLICQYFPPGIGVSEPQGGAVFWIKLPQKGNVSRLFDELVEQCISIAPGVLFAPSGKYNRHFRLSFGLPWNNALVEGVKTVGQLLDAQLAPMHDKARETG